MAARSDDEVSPVLTAVVTSMGVKPMASAASAIPAKGRSRFSATSVARARSGER